MGAINPPQCDFRRVPMSAANCTFRVKFWRVAPAFRRVPMGIVQRSAIAPIKPWLVGCKHLPPQLLHKADARSAQFALRIGSLVLSGASGRQAHRAFARKESCADRPSKNGGFEGEGAKPEAEMKNACECRHFSEFGRGRRTRTFGCWIQNPVPYQLGDTPTSPFALLCSTGKSAHITA